MYYSNMLVVDTCQPDWHMLVVENNYKSCDPTHAEYRLQFAVATNGAATNGDHRSRRQETSSQVTKVPAPSIFYQICQNNLCILSLLQTCKPDNQFETMRHTIWSLFCMKLMCQLCSTTSSHLNLTLYEEYSNIIHQPSYCRIPDQPLQLASATPALLLQAGPHDTAGLYFTWNTLYLLHWTFPFQLEVQREEWSQRSKEHEQ